MKVKLVDNEFGQDMNSVFARETKVCKKSEFWWNFTTTGNIPDRTWSEQS